MNENTNRPTPPQPPRSRKAKKSNVVGLCTIIALSGVLLSGAAGYGGYKLAQSQNTSSASSSTGVQIVESTSGNNVTVTAMDVSDVVASVRPTVVEITTEIVSSGNSMFSQYVASGAGSGVIISQDGYIVTNHHVIEDAQSISVKTYDGNEYSATLVGSDSATDIAVLKIDAEGLTAAVIGNSDDIKVGEAAIAIGNPLGSLGGTVTTGIISAVGREITINDETMTLLQTDAAINSGNSGGGLFDVAGQLIGIVNAKKADTGIEGLGFAIPISDVTSVIEDLIEHGEVTTRPVLNVSLQTVSQSSFYGNNSSITPGIYIVQIVEGGTADNAGLQSGDRIISFDGVEISSVTDVKTVLKKHSIGDVVEMEIERDGQTMVLQVTLQGSN